MTQLKIREMDFNLPGCGQIQALTPQAVDTVWVAGEHATMLNVENVEKLGHALAMRLAGD